MTEEEKRQLTEMLDSLIEQLESGENRVVIPTEKVKPFCQVMNLLEE